MFDFCRFSLKIFSQIFFKLRHRHLCNLHLTMFQSNELPLTFLIFVHWIQLKKNNILMFAKNTMDKFVEKQVNSKENRIYKEIPANSQIEVSVIFWL